jgi:hypothetical protein
MTDEQSVRFEQYTIRTDGCWHWLGSLRRGYGRMRVSGKTFAAHRVSYEHFVGSIPGDLTLDHLCRNTSCVNPAHLEPVTARENTLRGVSPVAVNAKITECRFGHPLSLSPSGARKCYECSRTRSRKYYYSNLVKSRAYYATKAREYRIAAALNAMEADNGR